MFTETLNQIISAWSTERMFQCKLSKKISREILILICLSMSFHWLTLASFRNSKLKKRAKLIALTLETWCLALLGVLGVSRPAFRTISSHFCTWPTFLSLVDCLGTLNFVKKSNISLEIKKGNFGYTASCESICLSNSKTKFVSSFRS